MPKTHYDFKDQRLTLRQMQVLSLNLHGLTQRQIAGYLDCSEGTVKTHLKDIANILHLGPNRSRVLIGLALENGFDSKGHYQDEYLFDDNATGLPWEGGGGKGAAQAKNGESEGQV
jgi:DNA-binding CsgD family transcriptional regulator